MAQPAREETRTLSSLDAAESRTLCEAFVRFAELETARPEARTFACTERALLSELETPEACEDYVTECAPGVAYESTVDCATHRFDPTCDVSVELFELCATEHVARITGVGRYPIDCSLAGTEDVAAALAAEPWEDCVVFLDVGIQVVFDQLGDGGRTRLCDLRTTEPVAPGECTEVSCTAPVPAQGVFEATADDEGLIGECAEANNAARSEANCLM